MVLLQESSNWTENYQNTVFEEGLCRNNINNTNFVLKDHTDHVTFTTPSKCNTNTQLLSKQR